MEQTLSVKDGPFIVRHVEVSLTWWWTGLVPDTMRHRRVGRRRSRGQRDNE